MKKVTISNDEILNKTVPELQELLCQKYNHTRKRKIPIENFKDVAEGLIKSLETGENIIAQWNKE